MSGSVLLTLDTRAPALRVVVAKSVEPPDELVVEVESDEDLGVVSVALLDALGRLFNLGYERVSDRSLMARVPTTGLATGPASLRISASDEVLNFAESRTEVMVRRPRAFDVEWSLGPGHEVALTRDGAYEAAMSTDPAHSVTLEVF